jgi:hypothetical protein
MGFSEEDGHHDPELAGQVQGIHNVPVPAPMDHPLGGPLGREHPGPPLMSLLPFSPVGGARDGWSDMTDPHKAMLPA